MLKLYFNVVIHFTFLKSTEICHIKCLPHVLVQESASLRPLGSRNIQSFFHVYQLQSPDPLFDNSGKHMLPSNTHHVTRADLIRKEHDPGKKRKKVED